MRRLPENHPIDDHQETKNELVTQSELSLLAKQIKLDVRNAELHLRDSLRYALEAGKTLFRAKNLVPHGQWAAWFESNCFDFSERTAQRYMRLYRKWKETANTLGRGANPSSVSDLTIASILEVHAKHLTDKGHRAANPPGKVAIPGSGPAGPDDDEEDDGMCERNTVDRTPAIDELPADVSNQSRTRIVALSRRKSPSPHLRVNTSRTSDEWLTPAELVQAAERMLGGIDLDPAADVDRLVPADNHYTIAEDGLASANPWHGKLLLNPPVEEKLIAKFVAKLLSQRACGNATEAILLVPARTNERWFRRLRTNVRAFIAKPEFGSVQGMPEPIVAIYLGDRTNRFYAEFERLGDCYVPFCAKHVRHLDSNLLYKE